jgi:hypothetical protein
MLLQFTARVDAAAHVAEPFGVIVPPYTVALAADEANRVVELRVQKQVSLEQISLPRHQMDPSGNHLFDTALDEPHFQDVLDLVQYIESLGSFHFNLRRIHWTQGEYAWIPESPEEQRALQVYSLKIGPPDYPVTPVKIRPGVLGRLVNARTRLGHLTVPMAFFREGVNEFRAFRYISAFHNHYFFLEGLFGEGKTNNKQVLRQFRSSPTLCDATQAAINWLDTPGQQRHNHKLRSLAGAQTEWSVQGVLGFLIWMRGNLHHFSLRSSTPKGHPLNHREFESVAYMLQVICYEVVRRIAL